LVSDLRPTAPTIAAEASATAISTTTRCRRAGTRLDQRRESLSRRQAVRGGCVARSGATGSDGGGGLRSAPATASGSRAGSGSAGCAGSGRRCSGGAVGGLGPASLPSPGTSSVSTSANRSMHRLGSGKRGLCQPGRTAGEHRNDGNATGKGLDDLPAGPVGLVRECPTAPTSRGQPAGTDDGHEGAAAANRLKDRAFPVLAGPDGLARTKDPVRAESAGQLPFDQRSAALLVTGPVVDEDKTRRSPHLLPRRSSRRPPDNCLVADQTTRDRGGTLRPPLAVIERSERPSRAAVTLNGDLAASWMPTGPARQAPSRQRSPCAVPDVGASPWPAPMTRPVEPGRQVWCRSDAPLVRSTARRIMAADPAEPLSGRGGRCRRGVR